MHEELDGRRSGGEMHTEDHDDEAAKIMATSPDDNTLTLADMKKGSYVEDDIKAAEAKESDVAEPEVATQTAAEMLAAYTGGWDTCLVTGATGFIAGHLISQLLAQGQKVRGTVRSLSNVDKVAHLRSMEGAEENLTLVEADLSDAASWFPAVLGCNEVYHTASPFPISPPKDENELIKPAVEGTTFVLTACAETFGNVKRVVLTSSTASVSGGYDKKAEFDESDWSVAEKCGAYPKV